MCFMAAGPLLWSHGGKIASALQVQRSVEFFSPVLIVQEERQESWVHGL